MRPNDDGMLSQEEIDALLGGADGSHSTDENNDQSALEDVLTPMEIDALGEIGNIAFGSAATALSALLNQKVDITTPKVSLVHRSSLYDEFPTPYVSVFVEYTEGFRGSNVLLIKKEDASIIADLMLGGNGTNPSEEIQEIHLSAVQEAMNQMMGSSATAMSMMFDKRIDISPPVIEMFDIKEDRGTEHIPSDDQFLKVSFRLRVGELIDSNIMQLLPIDFTKELVHHLMLSDYKDDLDVEALSARSDVSENERPSSNAQRADGEPAAALDRDRAAAGDDAEPVRRTDAGGRISASASRLGAQEPVHVRPVAFSEFDDGETSSVNAQNIDLLLDIPLTVTVELGRTKRRIKDILDLSRGSVIELDKLAGEPVDILVNHKPIAKGEVVVIDENFGVRITEILNQHDRLKRL